MYERLLVVGASVVVATIGAVVLTLLFPVA